MGTTKDRIKLCEAMGWTKIGAMRDKLHGYAEGNLDRAIQLLPDPFTDANDDYAVLEWMRAEEKRMEFPRYVGALSDVMQNRLAASHAANYRIGDYARAALKVIDD